MSLTVTIIGKLSQTDFRTAKRALETAMAFDGDANAAVPEEFTHGAGARCYALATIAEYRPALFWCGLLAVSLIPVLAAVKVLHG